MHAQFEELLSSIQPKEELIQFFEKAVEKEIEYQKKHKEEYMNQSKKEIAEIDKQIAVYIKKL